MFRLFKGVVDFFKTDEDNYNFSDKNETVKSMNGKDCRFYQPDVIDFVIFFYYDKNGELVRKRAVECTFQKSGAVVC